MQCNKMQCNKIIYNNFRCIEHAELEFSPGVNLFTGANAQGKTSALEGIFLFARGKSFRTAHDVEMIRFGEEAASVEAVCLAGGRTHLMRVAYSQTGKRLCRRNDIDIRRLSEFVGTFRAVLFCPHHLTMVSGGPSARRSFVDEAISQIKPAYLACLQRYYNILAQRNTLIKSRERDRGAFDETIEYWSEQLAREGEAISRDRADYTSRLCVHADAFISDMTGGAERLTFTLRDPHTKEDLLKELTSNFDRECRAGATLFGPHKDDVEISLSGRDARKYSSQGQQRSIALAMKLAEGEISRELTGEAPVLALDDVLSELDPARRAYVIAGFKDRQIFLTTCESLPALQGGDTRVFNVDRGRISVQE